MLLKKKNLQISENQLFRIILSRPFKLPIISPNHVGRQLCLVKTKQYFQSVKNNLNQIRHSLKPKCSY